MFITSPPTLPRRKTFSEEIAIRKGIGEAECEVGVWIADDGAIVDGDTSVLVHIFIDELTRARDSITGLDAREPIHLFLILVDTDRLHAIEQTDGLPHLGDVRVGEVAGIAV